PPCPTTGARPPTTSALQATQVVRGLYRWGHRRSQRTDVERTHLVLRWATWSHRREAMVRSQAYTGGTSQPAAALGRVPNPAARDHVRTNGATEGHRQAGLRG